MIIGVPYDVQPAQVIASNVELEQEWSAGEYTGGTVRRVGDRVYEVVAGVSTTDEPTAGAVATTPTWIDLGFANRYRAFDGELGRGVERTGTIEMTVQLPAVINTVFFSGLQGTSLRIEVLDGDTVVQDETYMLIDVTGIDNIWSFIYEPIRFSKQRALQGLLSVYNAKIRITLDAGAGDASIGELVLTRGEKVGIARMGAELGLIDFSDKEAGTYGGYVVVERGFADTESVDVVTETEAQTERLIQLLKERRARPTLYIAAKSRTLTVIYGYLREYRTVLTTSQKSITNVKLRSLTDD